MFFQVDGRESSKSRRMDVGLQKERRKEKAFPYLNNHFSLSFAQPTTPLQRSLLHFFTRLLTDEHLRMQIYSPLLSLQLSLDLTNLLDQ